MLSKYNLPFEMQIFDNQIPDAVKVARYFPDTPIILQHLGWPTKATLSYLNDWKNRLAELADCPHVFLKISCLGWIFQQEDQTIILSYLNEALKLFGPNRCIVGSNCPSDRYHMAFETIFRIIKKALSNYSLINQQKVFYGNAKKIYCL